MKRTHRKKEKSEGRNRTEKIRDYDNLENVEHFPTRRKEKLRIVFIYISCIWQVMSVFFVMMGSGIRVCGVC